MTLVRSPDLVDVFIEMVLKDAPVDPYVTVIVVWFVSIDLESELGRLI